mmetsp:Transcript_28237/g.24954  ORF Transcript_28237/g.24954 Transcript_28237/m.24954 type:complete len:169 (+) Transcript_28237:116-622(+)
MNILNELREIHEQRDLAVRIIQFYWRQYLDYVYDEDIEPQQLLHKPHSPESTTKTTQISNKQKERLGLIDYDYIPKISEKSRQLANKRRKNLGLNNLNVEDVLICEGRIQNALKDKTYIENSISNISNNTNNKKATKKQVNAFYSRQNRHRDRVNSKVEIKRQQTKQN